MAVPSFPKPPNPPPLTATSKQRYVLQQANDTIFSISLRQHLTQLVHRGDRHDALEEAVLARGRSMG